MQKTYFTRRAFTFVLLIVLTNNLLEAATQDSIGYKKRFNIGVSVNSLIHFPYLSVDYRLNERLGLTLEAKPRVILFETTLFDGGFLESSLLSRNYKMKGFHTNVQLMFLNSSERKWSLTPAIELSYAYKYLREERISSWYYDFYSISTTSLNAMLFYGKESFRLYLGLGVAYHYGFQSGYTKVWHRDEIYGYINDWYSIYQIYETFNAFDLSYRVGFRFRIIHW
jgi:hypothetical protein